MTKPFEMYTIYGQIEAVVAQEKEGTILWLCDGSEVPPTQRRNERGDLAQFAVIIPNNLLHVFEKRVSNLYQ